MNSKKKQPKTSKIKAPRICAKDIMSEIVVTVKADMMISDAVHLMLRDRINGLPVIDKSKNLIGILTLTNIFILVNQAVHGEHYDFYKRMFQEKKMTVGQAMSRHMVAVNPKTPLEEVIHLALTENRYTIPVLKQKKLTGVIGRHDILNAIFSF